MRDCKNLIKKISFKVKKLSMVNIFIYNFKRIVEFFFMAFSNRRLRGFKEKLSASKTLSSLYLKSIGNSKEKQVTTKFFDFKITGLNAASLLYLYQEIFLNEEYFFQCRSEKPKIIDCGANIGAAVIFFKKLFPLSEIIAIEPNPLIFKLLEKNVKDNNFKGVTLMNCCLSNTEGYENFYVEKEGTNNLAGSIYEIRGNTFEVKVESKRLSSIMNESLFDLIKIDVEGAERQIFQDLVETNKMNQASKYYIEYHHHSNMEDIFSEMINYFTKEKFNFNIRSSFKKPTLFQDIIILFYKK